jgi:glycosyltransferase involved in cell wall biosynthesis
MSSLKPQVAYFYISFPKITETFNLREMRYLQQQGFDVSVFSLLPPKSNQVTHKANAEFLSKTYYSAWFFSKPLWLAQAYYLSKKPKTYFTVLWQLLRRSYTQPSVFLKTLAIFPKSVFFAYSIEQQGNYKHLHATFASHNTTSALIVSALTEIPFSFTSDAYDLYVETVLLEYKLEQAAFSTTISNFNINELQKRYQGKVKLPYLMRRGIDLERFKPLNNRPKLEKAAVFELVCVGALEEKKGHKFLIEALAILKKQEIPLYAVFIGEGDLRKSLKMQAANLDLVEEIEFKGAQTEEQVIAAYQHCHCGVLASIVTKSKRAEGIPNALMEAMACQLPVIGTRTAGLAELIDDRINGLLVEEQNAQALAEALAFIWHNRDKAAEMAIAARHKIEKDFNMEINPQILLNLYQKAIS